MFVRVGISDSFVHLVNFSLFEVFIWLHAVLIHQRSYSFLRLNDFAVRLNSIICLLDLFLDASIDITLSKSKVLNYPFDEGWQFRWCRQVKVWFEYGHHILARCPHVFAFVNQIHNTLLKSKSYFILFFFDLFQSHRLLNYQGIHFNFQLHLFIWL